jgi:hypothetical protein
VPIGIWTAIDGAALGAANGSRGAVTLPLFPISQVLMFAACVAAAVWKRRRPEIHRRFIVLSTALAVTPALSRLPFIPNPCSRSS